MSDIHSEIAAAAAAIETQRAELEPAAAELVDTASRWASELWERIVGNSVAASPELVKANQSRLPALKEQLRTLQSDAANIANQSLAPWVPHRSLPDDELVTFARNENWLDKPVHVSLPRASTGTLDDPLRRLAGAIGPALSDAGLLVETTEVDASGRYRYALPDDAVVRASLGAYEAVLTEFIRLLYAHVELKRKRDSDEATQLWHDA